MNSAALHHCPAPALGRSLRLWRQLRRLKQAAAAAALGVSQTTISRWESGQARPTPPEQRALRALLAARPDSAADFQLARLVEQSRTPVHLICDLTHRLLALSPSRERGCRRPRGELIGAQVWRYATEDIVQAEATLDARGWYEPAPAALEFDTRAALAQDMPILASRMRWVRLQLSDGSYVRLVETMHLDGEGKA